MKLRLAVVMIFVSSGCVPAHHKGGHAAATPLQGTVLYGQFSLIDVRYSEDNENWHLGQAVFRNAWGRKFVRIRLNGQPLPSARLEGAVVNISGQLTLLAWDTVSNNLCFRGDEATRFASDKDRHRLQDGC